MTNTIYTYKKLKEEFSPNDLYKFLIQEKYTYKELQAKYHYNERLWSKYAKECNIPKQWENIHKNHSNICYKSLPTQEIVNLYVNQNKSLRDIAKTYNVNHNVIANLLKHNNIKIRPFNYATYYDNRKKIKDGAMSIDNHGYIMQYGDRQHRNVVRDKLHRPLTSQEVIHHIDHDKTNNNIDNLYIFPDNNCHILYHGQSWTQNPDEFTKYYQQHLLNTLYDADWLYAQYITLQKSVSQISKELKVSRGVVTKSLRNFNIYNLRARSINQYDDD